MSTLPIRRLAFGFALLLGSAALLSAQTEIQSSTTTPPPAPAVDANGKPVPDYYGQAVKGQKPDHPLSANEQMSRISEEFSTSYTYVAGAKAHSGTDFGSMTEQTTHVDYRLNIPTPIGNGLAFQLGGGYRRYDFGNAGIAASLPQSLEAFVPSLGAAYRLDDKWSLFSRFSPEIESVDNKWDNDTYVRYGGAIGASWKRSDTFKLSFGLAINPGLDGIPVLPIGSLEWKFAPQWELIAGFPKTAIEYRFDEKWKVWAGPSFEGGRYRTGSTYGAAFGRPALSNQRLEYSEVRIGAGAEYRPLPFLGLEAQVGGDVYRQFDFKDAGYKVDVKPAPYVECGVRANF